MKPTITRKIEHCARCGEDHKTIAFHKIRGNYISIEGEDFQYYGWCPKYLEPIILHVGEDDEDFEDLAERRTDKDHTKKGEDSTLCGCTPKCEDSQSSPDETEPVPTD